MAALAVYVAVMFVAASFPGSTVAKLWPFAALAFAYIGWEFWRYVETLDELERRLQMEAMAWTYLAASGLAAALGSVALILNWNVNPLVMIAVEPLRAWRLYVLARRHA
jgi:hypothetical protein